MTLLEKIGGGSAVAAVLVALIAYSQSCTEMKHENKKQQIEFKMDDYQKKDNEWILANDEARSVKEQLINIYSERLKYCDTVLTSWKKERPIKEREDVWRMYVDFIKDNSAATKIQIDASQKLFGKQAYKELDSFQSRLATFHESKMIVAKDYRDKGYKIRSKRKRLGYFKKSPHLIPELQTVNSKFRTELVSFTHKFDGYFNTAHPRPHHP